MFLTSLNHFLLFDSHRLHQQKETSIRQELASLFSLWLHFWLHFCFILSNLPFCRFGPLGAESVSAAFDRSIRQKLLSKNEAAIRRAEFERSGRDSAVQLLQFASQVVMYLCACNAEITPDPEQKSITRRTPGVIKDRYAEVCKWDVGFRFGATVRAQQQAPATENSVSRHGSHTAKRPHMRRGHWHHFWTGPMDSAQDRKLVLKWLPPIFVGSSQDGEMPVTLHKVKL